MEAVLLSLLFSGCMAKGGDGEQPIQLSHTVSATEEAPPLALTTPGDPDAAKKVQAYLGVEDPDATKETPDTAPVVSVADPFTSTSDAGVPVVAVSDVGAPGNTEPAIRPVPISMSDQTKKHYHKPVNTAEKVRRQQHVIKYQTQRAGAMEQKLKNIRKMIEARKKEVQRRLEEERAEGLLNFDKFPKPALKLNLPEPPEKPNPK